MSELLETHIVRCPYHLAQLYLAHDVSERAESGEQGVLTLTAPGPGMELSKAVTVTFGSAIDPMHFDQPWRIHWKPQSGPYPEFEGGAHRARGRDVRNIASGATRIVSAARRHRWSCI
jgi:hypothetical protein